MARIKAVVEIDDIDTLKLLANPVAMSVVEFLGRPLSATELARKLQVPRTRLYHHLNRLRERGIIKIASTRKVGAIEERIYQVVARTYRASAKLVNSAEFREQIELVLTAILDATRSELARALESGVAKLDQRSGPRSTALGRSRVNLTPETAHGFMAELEALERRMEEAETDDGVPFSFVFTMYPVPVPAE
jgi:DNA-binding transcriptional ArsR family regulator